MHKSWFWSLLSIESWLKNNEFRNNHENFHLCIWQDTYKKETCIKNNKLSKSVNKFLYSFTSKTQCTVRTLSPNNTRSWQNPSTKTPIILLYCNLTAASVFSITADNTLIAIKARWPCSSVCLSLYRQVFSWPGSNVVKLYKIYNSCTSNLHNRPPIPSSARSVQCPTFNIHMWHFVKCRLIQACAASF